MEVVVLDTPAEMAALVADAIESLVARTEPTVLGVATGSSPRGVYRELVDRHRAGRSVVPDAAFLLDEYLGLESGHPQSYRQEIIDRFAAPLAMTVDRVHAPDVQSGDIPAACAAYEQAIVDAGGIDLQLLGIGKDGHIGFNEPGSSLGSRTRIKTLTEQSRADNSRFFTSLDEVPRHVVTQGVATIGEARHLVLIASGAGKATAVAAAVEGPITASCPASAVQLHPHVSVVLDPGAAGRLERLEYYREVHSRKPSWQSL